MQTGFIFVKFILTEDLTSEDTFYHWYLAIFLASVRYAIALVHMSRVNS